MKRGVRWAAILISDCTLCVVSSTGRCNAILNQGDVAHTHRCNENPYSWGRPECPCLFHFVQHMHYGHCLPKLAIVITQRQ
ncbi:hypothetical protein B6P86_12120 [Escherichia coli]|nr:hypothetical protein [Escherichia coli]EFN8300779.1 hypothetical protein [Escherichia coli]EFO2638167.1 hypothetical protein [Escherichia coli]EFO2669600.1 hypothetical protein [Escherichia coli]EFO2685665.1 hypothetical protein [Escherichia coli]